MCANIWNCCFYLLSQNMGSNTEAVKELKERHGMDSSVSMPFKDNGWPAINRSSFKCRRPEKHRLYQVMGIPCPCGPIPMQLHEENMEVEFSGDDIIFREGGQERFRLSDMFKRIEQLEQEVKELKE